MVLEAIALTMIGTAFFFYHVGHESTNPIISKSLKIFSFIPILTLSSYILVWLNFNGYPTSGLVAYLQFSTIVNYLVTISVIFSVLFAAFKGVIGRTTFEEAI